MRAKVRRNTNDAAFGTIFRISVYKEASKNLLIICFLNKAGSNLKIICKFTERTKLIV